MPQHVWKQRLYLPFLCVQSIEEITHVLKAFLICSLSYRSPYSKHVYDSLVFFVSGWGSSLLNCFLVVHLRSAVSVDPEAIWIWIAAHWEVFADALECRDKSVCSSTRLEPRRSEGRGRRVVGFSSSRSVEASSELFPHPLTASRTRHVRSHSCTLP